ncbi:hypothetical protein HYU15_04085, partial [Candidatus Woesearchaeota archaeon]|nr:hypothetical protein [Candidatus Woesearchaeota archaeon]
MTLAQLLQKLEGKFRELADLEQRVLAADKAGIVPLRRQFIDLLFGPRFFGSEEFFRMYAGPDGRTGPLGLSHYESIELYVDAGESTVNYDLLQTVNNQGDLLPDFDNRAYGETDAYQAIT